MKFEKTKSMWFTILVAFGFLIIFNIMANPAKVIGGQQLQDERGVWILCLTQLILALGLLAVMKKTGIFRKEEFAAKLIPKGLFCGLVGILFGVFLLISKFLSCAKYLEPAKATHFLAIFICTITTGLFEEFLCRGFIYNNMKRRFGDSEKGIKKAVIWSSVVFGLFHLSNINSFTVEGIAPILGQVIQATIAGVFFALVYAQTKSMWSVVIIHMIHDSSLIVLSMVNSEVIELQKEAMAQAGTAQLIFTTIFAPLLLLLPFIIANIVKWRKLKNLK